MDVWIELCWCFLGNVTFSSTFLIMSLYIPLTTHSTHFIYGYMASDIWLRTILIVRKETRCCHIGFSFRLAARVLLFFYMHHPTDRIAHTMAFVTPVVGHWLEQEIAQWVHPMKDRSLKSNALVYGIENYQWKFSIDFFQWSCIYLASLNLKK